MMELTEKQVRPSSFFLKEYNPGERIDEYGCVEIDLKRAIDKGYISSSRSNKSIKDKDIKVHSEFLRCPYCGVNAPGLKYHGYDHIRMVDWAEYPPYGAWQCANCGGEILYVMPWPDHPNGRATLYTLPAFIDKPMLRTLNELTREGTYFMEVPKGTPKWN